MRDKLEGHENLTIIDVWKLILQLVRTAEDLITGVKSGKLRKEAVLECWRQLDAKYHIVERLDRSIDFAKIGGYAGALGTLLGTVLELIDDQLIEVAIVTLIQFAVTAMNLLVFRKA